MWKWPQKKIAVKMIFAFFIVILMSTTFTSISFYFVSSAIVKKNVRESSIQIVKQAADSLSFAFKVGRDTSDLVYSDIKIQKAARDHQLTFMEQKNADEYINGFLNNLVYSNSFVDIIYVVREQEKSWGSGTFSPYKLSQYDITELPWVKEAVKLDGQIVWEGLQYDNFSGGGDNSELVIPVGRVLKDFNDLNTVGYILVNLNGNEILEKIRQIKLGQTGEFFVVNQKGEMMIHSDLDQINRRISNESLYENIINNDDVEFEFNKDGVSYYAVKQLLSNGWMIVGTVPIYELTSPLAGLKDQIVLSFILFTILSIIIGLFIANKIIQPIKNLTRQMKLVGKGDLTARTSIQSTDEIGLMSKQFNKMLEQVEDLMYQINEKQNQKKEAELRALSHRINPHFLFNTLSTIRWLIKFKLTDKAYHGISALNRLLEANMGKKGNFITVAEELDIIEKYLVLLELRYDITIAMNFNIELDVKTFKIPRMLLQPLVENAIFHGIVPKETDGMIEIKGVREDGDVIFTVIDNGIGMDVEKLHQLHGKDHIGENGWVGIGLQHVYESVNLYYPKGSSVQISNIIDEGTQVHIILKTSDGVNTRFYES